MDQALTDAELTELAMAADPDEPIPHDAPSLWEMIAPEAAGLLPAWYMPSTFGSSRLSGGWRRRLAIVLIVAFLAINAAGLCSTYGHVVIA